MSHQLSPQLRDLILSMNLGHSPMHRLGGWNLLEIMSRHGSGFGEPITIRFLVREYNAEYLEPGEAPVSNQILGRLLDVLINQARLVSENTRKVRLNLDGKYIVKTSAVYRITSSGIEFLNAMQRVVNAENTVVASTRRIDEFVDLVHLMRTQKQWHSETVAFHDHFVKMLEAFQDVMNGMRKLDADLREIATDLSFNHASEVAHKLQLMLQKQAVPAYRKLQEEARTILKMSRDEALVEALGHSAMAEDNLDAQNAVGDAGQLLVNRRAHMHAIQRQLDTLAQSFDPTPSAIQNSFDSIYLLFETLWAAVKLLTAEFDHVQRQTVDVKALTKTIDELLTRAETLHLPAALPSHLPMDRLNPQELEKIEQYNGEERTKKMSEYISDVREELTDAGSFPPVQRFVKEAEVRVYTQADNPKVVIDSLQVSDTKAAMNEFVQQVMQNETLGVIAGELTFQHASARDLAVTLFSATQYEDADSFAIFGRPLKQVEVLADSQPVRIHLASEAYVAVLPHAYRFELEAQ
ncbi:hypothetical protein [Lacticaseibacillus porcinae]|uniref:hypothetical protein n=1 Tax=Lacticaseibacillus porcinae TaxID=1123687 RepID=UPI000F7879B4|nr:hypothetical protein [Lacticaseibacillus porcinae]